MTDEEAFHVFLSRLKPHLEGHVGAHVQGDMQVAITMAQRLEVYRGGDGPKVSGKLPGKFNLKNKIRKRVAWHKSKGVRLGELSR